MKIYTKTGDEGQTGLFAGPRVSKNHLRIEACGTIDELNAFLGLTRAEAVPDDVDDVLQRIQNDLFAVGAELASPDPTLLPVRPLGEEVISRLEEDIDRYEHRLQSLQYFILPGGSKAAATLHVARTICRRAERRVVSLVENQNEHVSGNVLGYLNRLGDLLFVLARWANAHEGGQDVAWEKPEQRSGGKQT